MQKSVDCFPWLEGLEFHSLMVNTRPFLPETMPCNLLTLQYNEELHYSSEASALIHNLEHMHKLEALELSMGFHSINQFRTFLRALPKKLKLRWLVLSATLCDPSGSTETKLAMDKCVQGTNKDHTLQTDDVHLELAASMEDVQKCTCETLAAAERLYSKASSSYTTFIAAPERTYEGRIRTG